MPEPAEVEPTVGPASFSHEGLIAVLAGILTDCTLLLLILGHVLDSYQSHCVILSD